MEQPKQNAFLRSLAQSIIVAVLTSGLSYFLFIRQYNISRNDRLYEKKVELFDRFTAAELELHSLLGSYCEYQSDLITEVQKYFDSTHPRQMNGSVFSKAVRWYNKQAPELSADWDRFAKKAKEIDNLLNTSRFFFEDSTTIKLLRTAYASGVLYAIDKEYQRLRDKPFNNSGEHFIVDYLQMRDSIATFNDNTWSKINDAMTQEISKKDKSSLF